MNWCIYPPDAPTVALKWDSDSSKLTCSATGFPDTYTFEAIRQVVNDITVRELSPVKEDGSSAYVVLDNLTFEDTGEYQCYVNNGIEHYNTNSLNQTADTQVDVKGTMQLNLCLYIIEDNYAY